MLHFTCKSSGTITFTLLFIFILLALLNLTLKALMYNITMSHAAKHIFHCIVYHNELTPVYWQFCKLHIRKTRYFMRLNV